MIALDSNLEEKERYTFPVCEGIFCTGSNEMLYVYDWEGSAKAIDLNSGAESALLGGLYIENFNAEDQYLFLEYIDPDIGIKNNDGETARDMAKRLNMRTMEWNLQEAEKKLKNK